MGVVVEGGACGWSKRAAQGVFRRWEAQSGVSGSSGAAGAGPWAARSHSTTRTLLPPKKPLLDLNLVQISCSSDPATLNFPRVGSQPRYIYKQFSAVSAVYGFTVRLHSVQLLHATF